jgi:hypothetical protein
MESTKNRTQSQERSTAEQILAESKTPEIKIMTPSEKPFSKTNYLLMAGCAALIVIGFLLMSGGGSSIEGGFNPDIFSTRRIVVGPTIAFLGFLMMAFAIIYVPRSRRKKTGKDMEEDGSVQQ